MGEATNEQSPRQENPNATNISQGWVDRMTTQAHFRAAALFGPVAVANIFMAGMDFGHHAILTAGEGFLGLAMGAGAVVNLIEGGSKSKRKVKGAHNND
ncbi:MAG: hypothetical protein ACREHC_03730 [Candidatus Levyibacteriota bacterium]